MLQKSMTKEKLFLRSELKKQFKFLQRELVPKTEPYLPNFLFSEHHQSHAAAAFYPSPFEEAVVLCMDGVGEWATTSTWIGKGSKINPLWEISFPHSLGIFYQSLTQYLGFKSYGDEYKLMGLSSYGKPKYLNEISKLIFKTPKGFKLNLKYFVHHKKKIFHVNEKGQFIYKNLYSFCKSKNKSLLYFKEKLFLFYN